jgi:hypothetical protein
LTSLIYNCIIVIGTEFALTLNKKERLDEKPEQAYASDNPWVDLCDPDTGLGALEHQGVATVDIPDRSRSGHRLRRRRYVLPDVRCAMVRITP